MEDAHREMQNADITAAGGSFALHAVGRCIQILDLKALQIEHSLGDEDIEPLG